MTDVFFCSTKKALNNITSVFDTVWPMAVGMWNLRCMVNGIKKEQPEFTDAELATRFSLGSKIHGANLKRSCIDFSWEQQQNAFAWILLNNSIPIFEEWLSELQKSIISNLKIKRMQFPQEIKGEITRLKQNPSTVLTNSFYHTYLKKRDRCYNHIDALMKCYRVFKEARNCYMHNGKIADQTLIDEYNNYLPFATPEDLCVSEVPEFIAPVLDKEIQISLRGVVGFSYIIIKILVSLDTELLCIADAEKEFVSRYRDTHKIMRTLKPNLDGAHEQIKQYVRQCGFPTPLAVDDLTTFLLAKQLVRQP